MKENANQEMTLLLLPTQGAKKVNLTADFKMTNIGKIKRKMSVEICLPDKHYYSLDGPSHDTEQMLTSQAHHNLAPCWGFVSTILNHTSDNEKAC